jgi:hypothetical protein
MARKTAGEAVLFAFAVPSGFKIPVRRLLTSSSWNKF